MDRNGPNIKFGPFFYVFAARRRNEQRFPLFFYGLPQASYKKRHAAVPAAA